MNRKRWLGGFVATGLLAASAAGDVNLEWRPATVSAPVCGEVDLGLYAVADSGVNEPMAAVQVVFTWDNGALQLLGLDYTGAPSWLSAGFPLAIPLNEASPPQDGDGYFQALAPLGLAVEATPAGRLLVTFRFKVVGENPAAPLDMQANYGGQETIVWSGVTPNTRITGTLSGAVVDAQPRCAGDLDCDGQTSFADFAILSASWGGPGGDLTGDATTDFADFAVLSADFGCGAP